MAQHRSGKSLETRACTLGRGTRLLALERADDAPLGADDVLHQQFRQEAGTPLPCECP